MKQILLTASLIIILSFSAYAQGLDIFDIGEPTIKQSSARNILPEVTDDFYIAMMFYRFSGREPDFREMVKNSEEYKMTSDREKIYMIDRKMDEYRSTYNLITMEEPIILETGVDLSNYNKKLGGFLINNFEEDLFFPVRAAGKNYAIIPQGIMDKQWMSVKDEALGKKIEKYDAIGTLMRAPIVMSLSVTPVYADAEKAVIIDGEEYWLMAVRVNNMSLYSPELNEILWKSGGAVETENEKFNDLLQLR